LKCFFNSNKTETKQQQNSNKTATMECLICGGNSFSIPPSAVFKPVNEKYAVSKYGHYCSALCSLQAGIIISQHNKVSPSPSPSPSSGPSPSPGPGPSPDSLKCVIAQPSNKHSPKVSPNCNTEFLDWEEQQALAEEIEHDDELGEDCECFSCDFQRYETLV